MGGAEFRLTLLIGLFGALEAVILNKAMSLIVMASALPFRAFTVQYATVFGRWDIIAVAIYPGHGLGAIVDTFIGGHLLVSSPLATCHLCSSRYCWKVRHG